MKYLHLYPSCILAFVFLMTSSCVGQSKTQSPSPTAAQPGSIPSFLPKTTPPAVDPYFVDTQDTLSAYGPSSITRNILQDRNGTFWYATWEGIISYDGRQFTNHTLKENLIRFHVFAVMEDRSGNIWFGTIRGGLYRYDPAAAKNESGKSFTLFTTADGLANDMVLCMMQDRSGKIWIGTDGGVSCYEPSAPSGVKGQVFTSYFKEDGLSANSVNSIIQDRSGKIWFATRDGETSDVSYFDGKSFTLFKNEKGPRFSNTRSIIEDHKGNIWIGGQTGLYRYNGQSLDFLRSNFTGFIFEDSKGTIWLSEGVGGSSGMALTRYDGISFVEIRREPQVFGITEAKDGSIWFGTEYGACRYDGMTVTTFTKATARQ